ncbi:senescence-associated protein SPA15, chloroplastic-like isoform X2 [Hibiscus syriacus]|uniref:senescence-associated protein SPA15, chloroplastic-like isoform X2 n=1 Tax=Hibiscus syriacus TaxID=106335 RepID=UPI00192147D0|nr:senescence-associated protein SPA15, chloroplastic-like isoform X2 [Hibiscus syriacus]
MAFTSSKVPSGSVVTKNFVHTRLHSRIYPISRGFERRTLRNTPLLLAKLSFPSERSGSIYEKTGGSAITRGSSIICLSSRTCNSEATKSVKPCTDCPDASGGIMRLDARARRDVAILGSGFLKLDVRAREDTEKIDRGVKKKAECLHHIATVLRDKAQSRLKTAADKHWSDGALEFMKNIHDMMVSKVYKL